MLSVESMLGQTVLMAVVVVKAAVVMGNASITCHLYSSH